MEEKLLAAINDGLEARQVLLPPTVLPRLYKSKLPQISLTAQAFINDIFGSSQPPSTTPLIHATHEHPTKLLMDPMRNALISGLALRAIHRRVGWYLATSYLSTTPIIGLEPYTTPHVNDTTTTGHRILHESHTTIVAVMRAGEPIALGVSDVLPTAMFVHANSPADIGSKHLQGQNTVVLVDSVINSGATTLKFLERIRTLHATIRIVVVAGVVQEGVVSGQCLIGTRILGLWH